MTRTQHISCDWCSQTSEPLEEDDPIEAGWISVEKYDMMKEEIVDLDFCSSECIVNFFQ